jgi:quercetin dioxygenase-like cupin family protein
MPSPPHANRGPRVLTTSCREVSFVSMTLLGHETAASTSPISPPAQSPTCHALKRGIGDDFAEAGFVGPIRPLSPLHCQRFLRAADHARLSPPLDWDKGHAVTSRTFYEIATHPAIIDVVTKILGDDVMLWGASLLSRKPGAAHPWHSDMESCHSAAKTVSVWISLENTGKDSALMLIPGSQRFGVSIQEERHRLGVARHAATADHVLGWARERDATCTIVTPHLSPGEALFFDGRIWHGSQNRSQHTRRTLLLQYATPDTPIRIPDFNHLDWPFHLLDVPRPACMMIAGTDHAGVNRMVSPPLSENWNTKQKLSSRIHPLAVPLAPDPQMGWKPYPLFNGATADIQSLTCHASVLKHKECPHPPHRHIEEEILLVLAGEVDVILPDTADGSGNDRHRLKPGQFVYYPSNFAHTLETASIESANYMMFKWDTDSRETGSPPPLKFGQFDATPTAPHPEVAAGFRLGHLLEGPTECLRKLQAHVSTLAPGAGYPAHVDAYDVAIIVLEGEVETLGQRVSPHGVIFYAAGEPHGMSNPGPTPARYLVFEFHGSRTALNHALPNPPSLLAKITDARRWKRKLRDLANRLRRRS